MPELRIQDDVIHECLTVKSVGVVGKKINVTCLAMEITVGDDIEAAKFIETMESIGWTMVSS